MTDEEMKTYYDILSAAWKFFRKYIDIDGTVEAYRLMQDEARRMIEDFSQTDHNFAEGIFVTVCSAVQRNEIGRRGKRDGDQGNVPG